VNPDPDLSSEQIEEADRHLVSAMFRSDHLLFWVYSAYREAYYRYTRSYLPAHLLPAHLLPPEFLVVGWWRLLNEYMRPEIPRLCVHSLSRNCYRSTTDGLRQSIWEQVCTMAKWFLDNAQGHIFELRNIDTQFQVSGYVAVNCKPVLSASEGVIAVRPSLFGMILNSPAYMVGGGISTSGASEEFPLPALPEEYEATGSGGDFESSNGSRVPSESLPDQSIRRLQGTKREFNP
jgi:hypothetical protein